MNAHVEMLNQVFNDALTQGVAQKTIDSGTGTGRFVQINGRNLINFGSCSYLGLEHHPALAQGARDALDQYGTQFSTSRAYLSLDLYSDLENQLGRIFEKPVLVTASTTLGHLSAIPVLVGDKDAVILDMQVHSSVQMATGLLKARGITHQIIRHNDMETLEKKIKTLRADHQRIWYFADGVYSMYGDYAPFDELTRLLDKYPQFNLYIDDAHGMSWAGNNGIGVVRTHMAHHQRMVLAVSLNKSFATAGGALVFPDEASRQLVLNCGGTMIFSGPIQPPMLGAALASAKLHQTEEFAGYQRELAELTEYMNDRLAHHGLPQFERSKSPLFFIPLGLPRMVYKMIQRLQKDGFFVNPAAFPAVPMRRGGLRFMVTRHLTKMDIDMLVARIAYHYPRVLCLEGSSPAEVAKTFRIKPPKLREAELTGEFTFMTEKARAGLESKTYSSIREIPADQWNSLFSGKGNMSHGVLEALEKVFRSGAEPWNRWEFHYHMVRDATGEVVVAAPYTTCLMKDDMFSPANVSDQVEQKRKTDPFYLTSTVVMLGTPATKGDHLYLNREHSEWRDALQKLIAQMKATSDEVGASQIMLRDFDHQDAELRDLMMGQGYIQHKMLEVNRVDSMNWTDRESWLAGLGRKYRYNVRKEILAYEDQFRIVSGGEMSDAEIRHCFELYQQVHRRNRELNVFQLPFAWFEEMCRNPEFDIIRLYLADGSEPMPVGVMYSHIKDGAYHALIVGLDDRYRTSHNVYKQALYQTVHRAKDLNCHFLDLAYTAVLEKKKVGARPQEVHAYIQAQSHYSQAVLATMSINRAG